MAQELSIDVHGHEISIYLRGTSSQDDVSEGRCAVARVYEVRARRSGSPPHTKRIQSARMVDGEREGAGDGLDHVGLLGTDKIDAQRQASAS